MINKRFIIKNKQVYNWERQIPYYITHMWNLMNKRNKENGKDSEMESKMTAVGVWV